jgi:PAS domain S-box-containing protein
VKWFGSNTDMTERKRAEDVLRASEERFRIAAETANDVVYEWDLKQSVQWVGKIDEMLGYEPGEFARTLDGWAASVHPEDVERTMAQVQAHLAEGAPYAAEYRVRRKDGVYRWWSARGAVARTPDGKPVRWIGSITDITERKQAESLLSEQLDELQRWHTATLGRETRILDLKREVNEVLGQASQPPRYPSAESQDQKEK